MACQTTDGVTDAIARGDDANSSLTLVPFAGINLIRFRGSRINGLSLFHVSLHTGHSRQEEIPLRRGIMYVNYSLTVKNSSGRRNIIAGADIQVVVQHRAMSLSSSVNRSSSDFAKIRKRLLKLKIVIVIDGVLERRNRSSPSSAGCWLPAADRVCWPLNTALSLPFRG